MIDLNYIINRSDYKKMNNALEERAIEIAGKICDLMEETEVKQIGEFTLHKVQSPTREWYNILCLDVDEGYEYKKFYSLHTTKGYWAKSTWVEPSTRKQKLHFLNSAKAILKTIDKIKDERVSKIEEAIRNTEDLVK